MHLSAILFLTFVTVSAFAEEAATPRPTATTAPDTRKEEPKDKKAAVRCKAHGVNERLCTRCNPKLAPAFKSKGDWCAEHERPETQCAVCNPKLEKEGVKP